MTGSMELGSRGVVVVGAAYLVQGLVAAVGFLLLFFAKVGDPPFVGYCDPLAVADVQMECRSEADGHWRISMFNSGQIFQRG